MAVPTVAPWTAGLIGFVTFFSLAGVCSAAQAGGTAPKAAPQATKPTSSNQAAPSSAGLRNPQAYMQELASKLNPSTDKNVLLKGVSSQPGGTAVQGSAGTRSMSASSPVITAQVLQPGLDAKQGNVEKITPAPTQFMSFWNDPSLKHDPQANLIMASETAAVREKSLPAGPVANKSAPAAPPADPREEILGPLGMTLASMKPGVILSSDPSLATPPGPSPANFAAKVSADGAVEPNFEDLKETAKAEKEPWSLGADLDKYRAHAVREGSRDSGENIKKAFERAGLTLEDGANVFLLGYASNRGQPFRANDGKGLLDEPGKVPQRAGDTLGNAGLGLYSVADLILLNGLRDPMTDAYGDNHPVVRPLVFTGRMVGGVWKTTEEVGNAVTWGYFDNFTGCIGMCIEDILELLKNAGEAVTNVARAPVQLVAGKKEGTEQAMDWVLLVPLEFLSNATEMKGFVNMEDYKAAFEDKGVIGSVVELGGSSFLVYRGAKELADKLDNKHHHRHCTTVEPDDPGIPDTPPDTGTPPPPPPDVVFLLDGIWPVEGGSSGAILIDGVWTTIKTWRE